MLSPSHTTKFSSWSLRTGESLEHAVTWAPFCLLKKGNRWLINRLLQIKPRPGQMSTQQWLQGLLARRGIQNPISRISMWSLSYQWISKVIMGRLLPGYMRMRFRIKIRSQINTLIIQVKEATYNYFKKLLIHLWIKNNNDLAEKRELKILGWTPRVNSK